MSTSSCDSLAAIENSIRWAVISDAFSAVGPMLERYRDELEKRLQAAPRELPALRERTGKLFGWTLAMLEASRDNAHAKLKHLKLVASYGPSSTCKSQIHTDA